MVVWMSLGAGERWMDGWMDGRNRRAESRSSQLAAYEGRPGVGWQARTVFDYFDCQKRKKQDGLGHVSTSISWRGEKRRGEGDGGAW